MLRGTEMKHCRPIAQVTDSESVSSSEGKAHRSRTVLIKSPRQTRCRTIWVGSLKQQASVENGELRAVPGTLRTVSEIRTTPTMQDTLHRPIPPMPKIRIYRGRTRRNRARPSHFNRIETYNEDTSA